MASHDVRKGRTAMDGECDDDASRMGGRCHLALVELHDAPVFDAKSVNLDKDRAILPTRTWNPCVEARSAIGPFRGPASAAMSHAAEATHGARRGAKLQA